MHLYLYISFQILYLEGTSCTGKTTISNISVHYYNILKHVPIMRLKNKNMFAQAAYDFHMLGVLNSIDHKKYINTPLIVDRSPIAGFAYQMVHIPNLSEREINIMLNQYFPKTSPGAKLIESYNLLMIIPKDIKKTLELMKKRNNGIDILTEEYIVKQNLVFVNIAKHFNFDILYISDATSLKLRRHIVYIESRIISNNSRMAFNYAHKDQAEIIYGPMRRGYSNDAGWDLLNYSMEEISQQIWKINTSLIIHIKPGYFGLIQHRSSALNGPDGNLYPTVIQGGVIDSGYNGEIEIIVWCPKSIDLADVFQNRYTFQIVILPSARAKGFTDRPVGAGFGSSNNRRI